jgi:hypothetical protein
MSGDELVSLVQRADARDAREGAPKYTLFTEAEVEQLRKNIAVEDSASELEIDLQTRAKWGFIKSKIVEPAKAAVTKAWDTVSTAVVNTYEKVKEGVKTVVAVVSDAAKTVGTAIKSAALAVGDLIVQGAKAVWEGLKEAASFVVTLVCDAVAGFLDTVVKGLVRGFLEMAKWVVYIGGKMIAKVQGRSRAAVACVRRLGLGPFRFLWFIPPQLSFGLAEIESVGKECCTAHALYLFDFRPAALRCSSRRSTSGSFSTPVRSSALCAPTSARFASTRRSSDST